MAGAADRAQRPGRRTQRPDSAARMAAPLPQPAAAQRPGEPAHRTPRMADRDGRDQRPSHRRQSTAHRTQGHRGVRRGRTLTPAPWPGAVLLDRDGVLNVNRSDHVTKPAQWQWIPGAVQACARLASRGIPLAVVTNQAVLARGLLTEDGLAEIHQVMLRALIDVPVPVLNGLF